MDSRWITDFFLRSSNAFPYFFTADSELIPVIFQKNSIEFPPFFSVFPFPLSMKIPGIFRISSFFFL